MRQLPKRIFYKYAPRIISPIKELPRTKTLRVLFIASDNNSSSGAFLSMTTLNALLQEKFGIETYVILPYEGTGKFLLDEKGIKNKTLYSYNWIVRIDVERDNKFWDKVEKEKNYNLKTIRQITRFAKREQFDLIHINTTYSYVGAIAGKQLSLPVIWHLRELVEEDQGRTMWDREEGNQLISEADRVIAISQSVYDKYLPIVDSEKLRKIYNGIDKNQFLNLDKKILQNKQFIFIFVGTINLNKGQIQLVEACCRLAQDGFKDFSIWFIGTSNEKEMQRIKKIAIQNGIWSNIQFMGYQKNVADFYSKADISFTCSKFEAFGRTTVEAMLSGNLVIGANTGGTRELIQHSETGLLYQQGDSTDLYNKILYAINNIEEMQRLAKAGQSYMLKHMTAEINAEQIYDLYNDVLNNN